MSQLSRIPRVLRVLVWAVVFAAGTEVFAIPEFARRYQVGGQSLNCTACHSVPPKLNVRGEQFVARGFRLPEEVRAEDRRTIPLAVWVTARYEDQRGGTTRGYVPKVELIAGGPVGDLPLSYFVEWRLVSLETRADGSLRDRSGRIEDLILDWEINDRHSLQIGQFRAVNQVDVSRRLSVTEPLLFSAGLPGEPSLNPRIQSLRGFSPAGRSPGFGYTYHSVHGEKPADGLFHHVTVPFVGELSVPLTREARTEASFELQGPPKGVFVENYYRRDLDSLGFHAFLDDGRWLATGLGTLNRGDFYLTGGGGFDNAERQSSRRRASIEVEYLPSQFDRYRPGVGFRVERISGQPTAGIPYFVMSGPNTTYSYLLQIQYRFQEQRDTLFIDLSAFY